MRAFLCWDPLFPAQPWCWEDGAWSWGCGAEPGSRETRGPLAERGRRRLLHSPGLRPLTLCLVR